MSNHGPSYDLRACSLEVVRDLCERFHGYKSAGNASVYAFAVYEDGEPVAGYSWQPPPTGCARAVCPEAPGGVLSLSRMAAVDVKDRIVKVSRPLRRQMRVLIDRTRWPVLVTFSDEGQGHTGYVYKCSGWQATKRGPRPVYEDSGGRRASSYSNGRHGGREDVSRAGTTIMQRWEQWACPRGEALRWMTQHGWRRIPVVGKVWRSGNPAYTWVREAA